MLTISAKIRKDLGKKVKKSREEGIIPAILYGPKTKNTPLEVDLKEFEKAYKEVGESSLIQLEVGKEKFLVLIHVVEFDAISQKPIHVDFYQPRLDEAIVVTVPLFFEGEAPAVKNLGGTLVKNLYELEVKALPQKLPHEIKVNINKLATFEESVLVKDLAVPEGVKILKEPDETIAFVAQPEKIEEELEKPVEEKVEEVEKAEEKKEEDSAESEAVKEEK